MDMSILSTLSPEERAALKAALDQADQPDPVEKLSALVSSLSDDLKSVREELANLKTLVTDELIGGIKGAFDETVRAERMGDFKGKYGSMLDPLAETFQRTYKKDLHEHAFNFIDGMRGEEGYTDELGGERLKAAIEELKAALGMPPDAIAEVKAEAVPAPEAKGEAEEEPVDDDTQTAWDEIAAMKDREPRDMRNRNKPAQKKGA
jgi:hypothetical protein